MIPHPWPALVLALAAYRATRFIGWDDLPHMIRLRAWAAGMTSEVRGSSNAVAGLTGEEPERVTVFARPVLAHFITCPFCQGFWVSVATYVAWTLEPRYTLYAAAPWALSAFVGLVAKNLDP